MSAPLASVGRLAAHRYEFSSRWSTQCPADAVYLLLTRLGEYDSWWPQVRRSERVDEDSGVIHLRSALPFTLRMFMTRECEDPISRTLRAAVSGDLDGFVQWRVEDDPPRGAVVHFSQVVTLTHPLIRPIDRLLRPLLTWNHGVAMRGGAMGLQRALVAT